MSNIHLKSELLIPRIHHHHPVTHTKSVFTTVIPTSVNGTCLLPVVQAKKNWCHHWLLFLTVHFQSISKSFCLYLQNKCRTWLLLTSSAATITANSVITNLPTSSWHNTSNSLSSMQNPDGPQRRSWLHMIGWLVDWLMHIKPWDQVVTKGMSINEGEKHRKGCCFLMKPMTVGCPCLSNS